MKVVDFIERSQRDTVGKILRGDQSRAMVGGLWERPPQMLASARASPGPDGPDRKQAKPRQLELVLDVRIPRVTIGGRLGDTAPHFR